MVDLSIILPTYNRGAVIEKFILSLLNQTYRDWELIIVDDASTDATVNVISKYLSDNTRLISQKIHKGLPAARNAGVLAASQSCKMVFFGEDDVIFSDKNSLEILAKSFLSLEKSLQIGAIGPRLIGNKGYLWMNDVAQVGFITKNVYSNFEYDPGKVIEVPSLHACSLISKKAYCKVGGFDDKMYIGTYAKEEVDFYFRLRKAGYKVFYQPKSVLFHDKIYLGGCQNRKKIKRYYFDFRNSLLFAARFNGVLGPCRYMTLPILRMIFPNLLI